MAKIKICGLRREEDIKYVNKLQPDYVGFILSDGFKRSINMSNFCKLRNMLATNIKVVGVFVNEPFETINACYKNGTVDLVQLHGSETVEYCKQIAPPKIKVLTPADFDKIPQYENVVDYFMFDSGTGTGKVFDWSILPKTNKPFFLAGGLNCNNLVQAINAVNPYCVDMSSSLETDGYKDYGKIKQVIDIVRSNANE